MTTTVPNRTLPRSLLSILLAGAVGASFCSSRALATEPAAPPVIPAMKWLATLPAKKGGEKALAKLFAQGTATYVPVGKGTGYPVLFSTATDLDWLAAQLWGGKTFRVVSGQTHPNGDPIVVLDNMIIKTPAGALFNLFDAVVTRTTIADLVIGINDRGQKVPTAGGTLNPVPVSFLKEPVVIDDKPSVVLNYFADKSLPVIRRILDEIREIDGTHCKGLFLGRAHARQCTSFNCGEVPSALVDSIQHWELDTRYQWGFWTYFILNFGQPEGTTCDITSVTQNIEQELLTAGIDIDLSDAPPAN